MACAMNGRLIVNTTKRAFQQSVRLLSSSSYQSGGYQGQQQANNKQWAGAGALGLGTAAVAGAVAYNLYKKQPMHCADAEFLEPKVPCLLQHTYIIHTYVRSHYPQRDWDVTQLARNVVDL